MSIRAADTHRGVHIYKHERAAWFWWNTGADAKTASTLAEAKRQIDAHLGPVTVRPVVASGTGAAL